MRWIFFTLLLANIGYLTFNIMVEKAVEAPAAAPSGKSKVPNVELLSEGSVSERQNEVERVLGNPVRMVKEEPDETVAQSSTGLVDEVIDADAEAEVVQVPVCAGLGPFPNVAAAQNVSERLAALGTITELQAIDKPLSDSDYRVVLPPLKSVQEAFRRLRELKSQDIDSYVITQGPDAQGISLGVFSSKLAAERHQGNLADLGYGAEVKELPRVSRGYWLLQPAGVFDRTIVDDAIADFPDISVDESVCLN